MTAGDDLLLDVVEEMSLTAGEKMQKAKGISKTKINYIARD